MARLNITHDAFHGEWNYILHPTNIPVRAVNSG